MSHQKTAFFAYPSDPPNISTVAKEVKRILDTSSGIALDVDLWENNDISGYCLVDPIVQKIKNKDLLIADITKLNFNVVYEIGYAIGLGKRAFLVNNSSIEGDDSLKRQVGIFDTIGYSSYTSSKDLSYILKQPKSEASFAPSTSEILRKAPVYIISPRDQTDVEIRIVSRLKKTARVPFRNFDPNESSRLSARDAVDDVARSSGVILPLLEKHRRGSVVHNMRCAFVAGLSHAMNRETLLLQSNSEVVPLDLRDSVCWYSRIEQIDQYIADFASRATSRALTTEELHEVTTNGGIEQMRLGSPAAENEMIDLGKYFLPTDEYNRVSSGEITLVAGRKGAGKSALFFQLRNSKRRDKRNIVLDLHPEGFQLKKFKEVVLKCMQEGTREHTVTAFWEYLFLLEICYKLLEKDRTKYNNDHTIRDLYLDLKKMYFSDNFISEGDFAERLSMITTTIEGRFVEVDSEAGFLEKEKITEILYQHDINKLKAKVFEYLEQKNDVWLLFDNIDKGWSSKGVDEEDLLMLRCLIDSIVKLRRDLKKREINFSGIVFIRNDVYELMVDSQSDRGKLPKVILDWTDPELLREIVRLRLVDGSDNTDFDTIWRKYVKSHINGGIESSAYFIERSLMRPRALLEFLRHAKAHAVNLRKPKIDEQDIEHGEEAYSTDLINQIDMELRDVFPGVDDILYCFIESERYLDDEQVRKLLEDVGVVGELVEPVMDLLLWFGFFGLVKEINDEVYIYNVNYDMKKLAALIRKRSDGDILYSVNPAFWCGLSIQHTA